MSLRGRVAIAAMLATALVTVIAGWSVARLVVNDQRAALDATLRRQAEVIALPAILDASLGERRFVRGAAPRGVRFEPGVATRIVTDGGARLASESFPVIEGARAAGFATLRDADGGEWRVFASELRQPFSGLQFATIEVAASTAPLDETIASVRRRVITVGALAIGVAGAVAWMLASVATRPLERLRFEAQRVGETVDLSARVPSGGPREVRDLGATLNVMLGRIERQAARTGEALEASRSFAAHAAHELRTPLTSMQTNLDVLRRNPDLEAAERDEVLAEITEQQDRLLAVLEALRLLARGDLARDTVFEVVDLADLAETAVGAARARFPGASIDVDLPAAPVVIRGWAEGLAVMIDNLLRNACTHGAGNGGGARVSLSLATRDGEVELSVADAGPGIPEAERAAVLDRFSRGSSASGVGSGLGLALVAQQAELHGGEVSIGRGEAGGALVAVRLRAPATAGR
jgi:two-component system sensor histidine kinase PrrB